MQRQRGFTLIETLVALVIVGILLGMAGFMLRVPSAQLLANDVQSAIRQARLQAIKHNRPVAVIWDGATQQFTTRKAPDSTNTGTGACNSTDIIARKSVSEYSGNPVVNTNISNGLVWLPSGLLSTCNGIPNASMSITITARNVTRQLSISTAGEVSIQ